MTESLKDRLVIVITGEFSNTARYDIIKHLNDRNYTVKTNVTKTTDYLIAGVNPGNIKMLTAKEYGIPIIEMGDVFQYPFIQTIESS